MAQHRFRDLLRSQYRLVLTLHLHLDSPLHHVSAIISSSAPSSPPKLVPCDVSRWTCNTHQHDRARVRTGMGAGYGYFRLGVVVDRQCLSNSHLFPPNVGDVSIMPFI